MVGFAAVAPPDILRILGGLAVISDEIDGEIKQLSKDLSNEDDLGAVVRGHIRIENLLTRFIEGMTPAPRFLEGSRLDYYAKTSLALAMGMRENLKGPLRSLGSIRNTFAHEPEASLSEKNFVDFVSSFSKRDKEAFESTLQEMMKSNDHVNNPITYKDNFRIALVTLWVACRLQVRAVEQNSVHRK